MSRANRTALASGAIELLIALAAWWHPEHAMIWAMLAVFVLVIAGIVEHGTR